MIEKTKLAGWLIVGMLAGSPVHAALMDRGGGMIYDTDLNITWLKDANYAKTSGYDSDGQMNWRAANAWASNLVYGGYSDWRLPTSDTCGGYNCTGSELGHLFYAELGGTAGLSILSSGDPDLSLFQNIQPSLYWSGTAHATFPASIAWLFDTSNGSQFLIAQDGESHAWAVRPGDVTAVPEPASALLVGLGLAGLAALRRRRSLGAS